MDTLKTFFKKENGIITNNYCELSNIQIYENQIILKFKRTLKEQTSDFLLSTGKFFYNNYNYKKTDYIILTLSGQTITMFDIEKSNINIKETEIEIYVKCSLEIIQEKQAKQEKKRTIEYENYKMF